MALMTLLPPKAFPAFTVRVRLLRLLWGTVAYAYQKHVLFRGFGNIGGK